MKYLLLALLLLTACADKQPPLSQPRATATAVTPLKGTLGPAWEPIGAIINDDSNGKGEEDGSLLAALGQWSSRNLAGYSLVISTGTSTHSAQPLEGYLRSQPALAWPVNRVARLATAYGQNRTLENDSESPWEGLVVLPDLSVVYLDLEVAATQASISLQESTWRCDAYRTTVVAGVTYEVFGLFQLLYDSSMRRLTESMGFMKADLLSCRPNALVAQEWKRLTDKGVEWRLWVARPQYRTDGSTSYEGY